MSNTQFDFMRKDFPVTYLVSEDDYEGVKRIAKVHTEDFEAVCGTLPALIFCNDCTKLTDIPACADGKVRVVIAGTLGHSSLIDLLSASAPQITADLSGKREVYRMTTLTEPAAGIDEALVIAYASSENQDCRRA